MKAWRVIIAVFIVIAPLWVIAADQHLMHRMIFAFAAMPVVLLAISLAQDDGAKRKETR